MQRQIIRGVLLIAAATLLLISFLIKENKEQNLIRMIGYTLIVSAFILKLFNDKFGYKPTREEIEERMFGKDKTEVKK